MQPLYPGPLLTQDIVPKIPLYPFVYYLQLTISLGVVTSTGGQIGPNQSKKFLPESTHESAVPVADYGLGQPMQSEHIPEKQFYHLCCWEFWRDGKEMRELGQPVHHHINGIFSLYLR